MLTLRTRPGQRREFWIVLPIAGVAVILAIGYLVGSRPVPAAAFAGFAAVQVGLEGLAIYSQRIIVAASEVRVRDLAGPNHAAARDAVTSIHIYAYWTTLAGADGRDLLRSRPGWTTGQLVTLADYLAVPLYDHRIHHGLAHSAHGTLVTRPDGAAAGGAGPAAG